MRNLSNLPIKFDNPDMQMASAALLSSNGTYRWWLRRHVADKGRGTVNFIMLNPSTADAENDDPTIRRCMRFARRWGFDRLDVTNLYAYRSTEPYALRRLTALVAVGEDNDGHLLRVAEDAALVVAAWGVLGGLWGRAAPVKALLGHLPAYCLGQTKAGDPRHPLYLPNDVQLERYW